MKTFLVFYILSALTISFFLLFKSHPPKTVSAIVIPHFDFPQKKRQEFLKELSQKINPQKIIIVSPNHYQVGERGIISTGKDWSFEKISPQIEKDLLASLLSQDLVGDEEAAFLNEHGIKNVFPDLLEAFPQARYLPIIIKNSVSQEEIEAFGQSLFSFCPDCLLVASIDFSHECPSPVAEAQDQETLEALLSQDVQKAWLSKSDCPQAMFLLTSWARKQQTPNFKLFEHSNSAKQVGDNQLETTSYILGSYEK